MYIYTYNCGQLKPEIHVYQYTYMYINMYIYTYAICIYILYIIYVFIYMYKYSYVYLYMYTYMYIFLNWPWLIYNLEKDTEQNNIFASSTFIAMMLIFKWECLLCKHVMWTSRHIWPGQSLMLEVALQSLSHLCRHRHCFDWG
jgi:hypothetical protein